MSWLYACTIYPLQLFYKYVYLACIRLTGSYGLGLIGLSLCCAVAFVPLGRMAQNAKKREDLLQDMMQPQIDRIKAESTGAERQERIAKLYRRYGYHPLMSLRSAIGVLLQFPFLTAAYRMVSELTILKGQSFWIIKDLSLPDGLWGGVNALPIVMTLINFATIATAPNMRGKERIQAVVIALLFLWLLYGAPSALLVYWTCNNLNYLAQNFVFRDKEKNKLRIGSNDKAIAIFKESFTTVINQCRPFVNAIAVQSAVMLFFVMVQTLCVYFVKRANFSVKDLMPLFLFAFVVSIIRICSELCNFFNNMGLLLADLVTIFFIYAYVVLQKANFDCYLIATIFLSTLSYFYAKSHPLYEPHENRSRTYLKDMAPLGFAFVGGICFQVANNLQFVLSTSSFFLIMLSVLGVFAFALISAWCFFSDALDWSTFVLFGIAFCISWIFMPTVQAVVHIHNQSSVLFIVLFTVVFFLTCLINEYKSSLIPVFLILFAITSAALLCVNAFQEKRLFIHGGGFTQDARLDILQGLSRKHDGGVYFLVYDAIPDVKTMQNLGIDSTPLTKLLSTYGFKIYDNTYSLGYHSILSDALVFNIRGYAGKETVRLDNQKSCAGDNITFSFMHYLGYNLKNYLSAFYLNSFRIPQVEYLPQYNDKGAFANAEMRSQFLTGLFEGEFKSDQNGIDFFKYQLNSNIPVIMSDFNALRSVNHKNDFVVCHFALPGHIKFKYSLEVEKEQFIKRYNDALAQMKIDLQCIINNDPKALIIISGDHGPYLSGFASYIDEYNLKDITELMIRDTLGTLVSIRWPDPDRAQKYDSQLLVNPDIFPVVFSYICDSKKPLDLLINTRNAYYERHGRFRGHVFIKDGVFQKLK